MIVEKSHGAVIASGAVFVTLATIEILFSFICRSDRQPIYKIGFFSNKYMVICVVATLIIQYAMLMIPMTREWLKVDTIPSDVFVLILFVSVISIIIFELVKLVLAKIYIKEDI